MEEEKIKEIFDYDQLRSFYQRKIVDKIIEKHKQEEKEELIRELEDKQMNYNASQPTIHALKARLEAYYE